METLLLSPLFAFVRLTRDSFLAFSDVRTVNDGYLEVVSKYRKRGKKVRVSDCLSNMVRGSKQWSTLMIDQLHPSEVGQNKLMQCWREKLTEWGLQETCRSARRDS